MEHDIRRNRRRHHLIFYLPVNDRDKGERLGYLGDITTEGLMIISTSALPTDHVYELEVVDNTTSSRAHSVPLRGRTVWSHTDVNPDYYATGVELLDMDARTQAAVEGLIERIGFHEQ